MNHDQFGFLKFAEISQTPFERVLKELEVHFTEKDGKLIGDGFIVSVDKNLYFEKGADRKGGTCIDFVSAYKHCSLRAAAFWIKEVCGAPVKEEKKIPVLTLEYHPYLEDIAPADLCQSLGVGYVQQKSIMAKRICFKLGQHYVGYSPEKKDWHTPEGFKYDTLWNIDNCDQETVIITVNPFDSLFLIAQGIPNTASLMRQNMTEAQGKILERFKRVLLLHEDPRNIVERLSPHVFIKAIPEIHRPTKEQIEAHL